MIHINFFGEAGVAAAEKIDFREIRVTHFQYVGVAADGNKFKKGVTEKAEDRNTSFVQILTEQKNNEACRCKYLHIFRAFGPTCVFGSIPFNGQSTMKVISARDAHVNSHVTSPYATRLLIFKLR